MPTNSHDNVSLTKPLVAQLCKVGDHLLSEATAEPNDNTSIIEEEEHYLESPGKRKCPHCKQQLVHRVCGTAKFAGHTVLVSYDYCQQHGQPSLTKHQLKLAALVSDIKPLVKHPTNLADG